jgi:hypothetical protein
MEVKTGQPLVPLRSRPADGMNCNRKGEFLIARQGSEFVEQKADVR